MTSKKGQAYYRELCKKPAFGADGFDLARLRQIMAARREPDDPAVRCIPAQADGIPATWVLAPGAKDDVRLLYLHGGGYVSGCGAFYLRFAARLSAAAKCAVLLPDYRLAPEHPFPAGLEDCIRAYEWMTAFGPRGASPARAAFVAGDSAGGGLALATLLALRDRGRPLPRAAVTISACTDMTMTGESMRSQALRDPIMHPSCMPDFMSRYLGKADARNPLASPIFGDYHGVPPLLIQAGEHEIIRDDSVRAAAKAQADGTDATLEVWPGMFHVFQSHEIPEARAAIKRIASFLRKRM